MRKLLFVTMIFFILLPSVLATEVFFNGFEDSTATGISGFNTSIWDVSYGDGDDAQIVTTGALFGTYSTQFKEGDDNEVALNTTTGSIDLSGKDQCNLTFYVQHSTNLEAGDDLFVDIYDGTWNLAVLDIDGDTYDDGIVRQFSVNLTGYNMVSDFKIRLDWEANLDNEQVLIDDINVTCNVANNLPTIDNITASETTLQGGTTITIYANTTSHAVNDSNADTLFLYCDNTTTPTAANTDCTGGTTSDATYPYALSCSFVVPVDTTTHVEHCRLYDGIGYSSAVNVTYYTDTTAPTTNLISVAGDVSPTYFDTVNDALTEVLANGENGMECRWGTSDVVYSSMTNECTISGIQANCSINDVASQGFFTRYVSCRDNLTNEQSSSQNLDVQFYLDYTAPTTTSNAAPSIQIPNYLVTITEADNVDTDPTTYYCTATTQGCDPTTLIDNGGIITYTAANRGANYLRYYSVDDAGNTQTVVNKTVNINQLPIFRSATDNVSIIGTNGRINISTNSQDPDIGHELTLFVCNSTNANASGCLDTHFCNTTATENLSCTFATENDTGTYNWYAFIYDQLGEASTNNSWSGSYQVDATAPIVTITSPLNQTYTQTTVTATITLNETGTGAWYKLDNATSNVSMSKVSGTEWTASLTGLSYGSHNITFWANDSYDNVGQSAVRYFTVSEPADVTLPAITFNAPTNNTYVNPLNVVINITADEDLEWAGYQLNGSTIVSMSNSTARTYFATANFSQEQRVNITVYANDTSSNQNNKTIYVFADSLAPRYSNVNATPRVANISQSVNCSVRWDDKFNLTNVSISENSLGTFENHTLSVSGNSSTVSYTIPGNQLTNIGTYTCRYHAYDKAGNYNTTSYTFNVTDSTNPSLTLTSPTNATYTSTTINVVLVSNENLAWAGYSINGSANVTMTNTTAKDWNYTITGLNNGNFVLVVTGNESSGNQNTTSVSFNIDLTANDTTAPVVTIDTLSNGTYYTSTTLDVNVTTNEDASWVAYSLNSAANVNLSNYTSATNWNGTITGLVTESTNVLVVYANDTSSNQNQGNKSITFYVDTVAPRFLNVSTLPASANETQNVVCNAYVNDTFGLTNVKIEENSGGSFVNHSISVFSAGWMNYTMTSLQKGTYTCRFHATDAAGNYNTTSTSVVVSDVTAPTITINSPLNQSYSTNSISLSITTSESVTEANYSLDSGATNVSLTGSGTSWSKSIVLGNGDHTVTYYAIDSSGNIGSNTVSLHIDTSLSDTTPPTLTVWSPINLTYYTSANVLFNVTTDENSSWAGYTVNGGTLTSLINTSIRNWNKTVTLIEGSQTVVFFANDSSSNQNQGNTSRVFYVDLNEPASYVSCVNVNDSQQVTCNGTVTDNLSLATVILAYNATGTWQNSSNITISGTSDTFSYNISAGNTTPGGFGVKAYVYDSAVRLNVSETLVTIADDTYPLFYNISYYPNTTAELDPGVGVTFNVSIIEDYLIDTVSLMYRNASTSDWNAIIMSNTSVNNYNATLTLQNETWYIKYNASDAAGNVNVSNNYTLYVGLDDSFYNTTSIPTTKSYTLAQAGQNKSLGDIFVNNTGDSPLNVTVYVNSSIATRFSVNHTLNQTMNFTLASGNDTNITILVNTTSLGVGEYPYNITVSTNLGDTIYQNNLNIQNVEGPYLSVVIDTYSSTVTNGDGGVEFSATITNQGTSAATGTYLNWTLPSEFELASGVQNKTLGILGVGISATNTITVNVDSLTDKVVTITSTGTAGNADLDSDSKSITIGSPTTTIVTETVTSGGTAGGGGGASGAGGFGGGFRDSESLESKETIHIVRGESEEFEVVLYNGFEDTELDGVSLRLSGFMSQYMKVTPLEINNVDEGEEAVFTVKITSPEYLELEEYELTAVFTGTMSGDTDGDFTETRSITLVVHEISDEEVIELIEEANELLKAANLEGIEREFSTEKWERLLAEAEKLLEQGDYEGAEEVVKEVLQSQQYAMDSDSLMTELENRMDKYQSFTAKFLGVEKDFPETRALLSLALAAFERGDYETAFSRAEEAELMLAIEGQDFSLFFFIIDYWWLIILVGILLAVLGFVGYKFFFAATLSQRLKNLGREEERVRKLIKEEQRKYFKKGKTGGVLFKETMERLKKRLAEIKKDRNRLRNRRVKIFAKDNLVGDLSQEKIKITKEIKKLQEKYFVKRTIGKSDYNEMIEEYQSRLAEIEDEELTLKKMATKKVNKNKKSKIKTGKKGILLGAIIFVLFIFALLYPTINSMVVYEGDASREDAENAIFEAEQVMIEMIEEEFAVSSVNDTIYLAYEALQRADFAVLISENASGQLADEAREVLAGLDSEGFTYSSAISYANQVYEIQEQAYESRDSLRAMEIKVEYYAEEGYNVSAVEDKLNEASEEFGKERYVLTLDLIDEAENLLEEERSETTKLDLIGRSSKSFFVQNWLDILIIIVLFCLIGFIGYKIGRNKILKRRLNKLQHEEKSLKDLMKETQMERFHMQTMSKFVYERRMNFYRERLERVKAKIPVIKKMVNERKKVKTKKMRKKR